eukprot:gene36812-49649_t
MLPISNGAAFILLMIFTIANCFSFPSIGKSRLPYVSQGLKPLQLFQVADVDEIKPGERKIVDTEAGAVIVANVDGNFFAVNAKCPHLGLPMKKGKIEKDAAGNPTITCNFHNSVFSLSDGSCTAWCTGILGNSGKFSSVEHTLEHAVNV